jgi:hypothetical protein
MASFDCLWEGSYGNCRVYHYKQRGQVKLVPSATVATDNRNSLVSFAL